MKDKPKLNSMRVYIAAITISKTDMQSPEGLATFIDNALILLPEYDREALLEMEVADFLRLLKQRAAEIATEMQLSANGFAAVDAALRVVEARENED